LSDRKEELEVAGEGLRRSERENRDGRGKSLPEAISRGGEGVVD